MADQAAPFHPLVWYLLLCLGTILYGSETILIHLCEVDGKIPFSSASTVLLTESLKLILAFTMFMPEVKQKGFKRPGFWYVIPFAVPGFLYCMNNNMVVHIQLEMDPATYQVMGNLKILSTAILYRCIIKRQITYTQWVALGLLLMAGVCDSVSGMHTDASEGNTAGFIHMTTKGLIMILTLCFSSSLAGVFTEYIFKDKYEESIHFQNCLLYCFGVLLNGLLYIIYSGDFNLFTGYTIYTWILVFSKAITGLIISAIMKHGSNITRLFLISTAMLVTTMQSILIFGLGMNVYMLVSFLLVFSALALYYDVIEVLKQRFAKTDNGALTHSNNV